MRYIWHHERMLYTNLPPACNLNSYLADIDRQAEKMFSRLVKQMAEREGVTEALKVQDQMACAARMNNIRNRATEKLSTTI